MIVILFILGFQVTKALFQWQRPGGSNSSDATDVESGDVIYFPVSFPNATSQILAIDWETNYSYVKSLAIGYLYLNRFTIIANIEPGSGYKINQCGVISVGW